MKTFIDISGHNGAFTSSPAWAMQCTNRAGFSGVYIKSTEGLSYKFEKFQELAKAASDNNLLVGSYHFARPDPRELDYKREADYFLETIKGIPVQLPLALDLELADWGLDEPKALTQWAKNWLDYVKATSGLDVVLYTGPGFWKAHLGRTQELNDYKLWVAAYPAVVPKEDATPPSLGNWKPWAWQYSSKGTVNGLHGNVDVNRLYGEI